MTGIIPPLVTPLLDDGSLDFEGLARLVEHVISGGVTGIFLLGSTGEMASLSHTLRAQLIRETCRLVNGRVKVLAGVTDTCFSESADLARCAADAGADALVVSAPYYLRCSQADLKAWVERVIELTPLPIYLYNIPSLTKVAFEVETLGALSHNPRIVGFKDSSGDIDYLKSAIAATRHRPEFSVLIGPEEMLAEAVRLGCAGGVCGGANLHPKLFVGIYEAAARGDWTEAERLQKVSWEFSEAIYRIGDPGTSYFRGIKAALAAAGLCRATMALPLRAMDDAEQAAIRQYVATLSLR